MPERPRALLEAADEDPRAARLPLLRRLMEFVLHHDETAYLTRSRELAFLANTLLAGSSVQSRPFTPQEASDAAACICNLGLECWPARWPGATSHGASSPRELDTAMPPDAFLVDHDLVTAFEVGWSVLYQDVSLFVADQLMSTLADLHCVDADTRHGLRALRRTAREAARGRHTVARARRRRRARDARHDRLDQRARIAGRMSHPARGADSRSRAPHDVRQPDRVRVHLDDRPDWRHSPLHEDAPRRVVWLSAPKSVCIFRTGGKSSAIKSGIYRLPTSKEMP